MRAIIETVELKDKMRNFAVEINREVSIRLGHFQTTSIAERRWREEGPVEPWRLEAVCGKRV